MIRNGYRYHFKEDVDLLEVEATLVLSLWSVEALYGEARARLDAVHALDEQRRTMVVDASTPLGRALCRLLTGYLQRDIGHESFRVERISSPETVCTAAPDPVGS